MKMTLFLLLLFTTMQTSVMKEDQGTKTRKYRNMISAEFSNYIQTSEKGSMAGGCFYGVEFHENGTPIFYLSHLEDVFEDRQTLKFSLKKYRLSYGKWTDMPDEKFEAKGPIPGILLTSQYFVGEQHGDSLLLKRTSDFYDSRVDELVFLRDRND